MTTVWLVPGGSDSADGATDGDYLLRPRAGHGDQYEVGRVRGGVEWIGTLAASLLPQLPVVDGPQEAPDQPSSLAAVQGVESAQTHRGG